MVPGVGGQRRLPGRRVRRLRTPAASRLDARLLEAVRQAREALEARDAGALAAMMPSRERWRLFPTFADDAAFLDIETDGGDLVTAVGVLDRAGPRVFLRGRDLDPRAVEEAIRLSDTTYCSVYASLAPTVEIVSRFEIIPA